MQTTNNTSRQLSFKYTSSAALLTIVKLIQVWTALMLLFFLDITIKTLNPFEALITKHSNDGYREIYSLKKLNVSIFPLLTKWQQLMDVFLSHKTPFIAQLCHLHKIMFFSDENFP